MKLFNKGLFVLMMLSLTTPSKATVIAIIDSGTDLSHKDLASKAWTNSVDVDDAVDNDDNGYIDDVHGWNFADGNNKLYDKSFLGTFSPDCYKYFEVQTRLLKGTGTADDLAWIRQAQQDEKLMTELETFANFVHGSHVAGISSRDADKAQLMILKIIATKPPTIGGGHKMHELVFANLAKQAGNPDALIKTGLKLLASQQSKALAPIGAYVQNEKARVANCSFGTSTAAAKGVLAPLLKMILKRDATPDELQTYSAFFVGEVVKAAQTSLLTSKGTLFVIAAGNDGMDNDQFPTSPANVKQDNTIAVAATLGYDKLATFSNYGQTMVEVAAPGVGIESTIPGNQYLTVSGTSQAAPFVTNAAGLILDQNPSLSNADVKQILMATTDLKAFLKGKVVSGGIVNTKRAMMAAKLSTSMQLSDAISTSRVQVNDVDGASFYKNGHPTDYEGFVMPLPSLFY